MDNRDQEKLLSLEKGIEFWYTLLSGPLTPLLQDEKNASLRAVGCDCLGSIGPHIFEHLKRDKQFLIITLLFACSKDNDSVVKAAAVRALGICVQFPTLREDTGFIIDVAETIYETLQDNNVAVKIKSSWSLGNLSDTLVLNRSDSTVEEIPRSLLIKLLQITIKLSEGNDKVKMNTVRALGNLLQLVEEDQKKTIKEDVERAFNVLVKCATTGSHAKVRWNACYALGNALRNRNLYFISTKWQSLVFSSLSNLVINHNNFKVRINAGFALSSPSKRVFYGQDFISIWNSLLSALENAENMEDFNEYKHRDHLVEQICITLAHFTTLLTPEDLISIHDTLHFYSDLLQQQMHRVIDRLVPEKSAILMTAAEHVKNLILHSKNYTESQKVTLNCLSDILSKTTLATNN